MLGILLSALPTVQLAGELYKFPFPTWKPGRICSCGQPVPECPFWTAVVRRYLTHSSLEQLRAGELRYESWGAILRSLLAQAVRTRGARAHAEHLADFLRSVAAESGRSIIVDASRGALRARLYSLLSPADVEVAYIHLVRDGRTYMYSELTQPGRIAHYEHLRWLHSRPALAFRWAAMNLLAIWLCSGGRRRYIRVRYEELVRDPEGVLSELETFLQMDLGGLKEMVRKNEPIQIPHIISGNRFMRQSQTAKLWSRPTPPEALDRRTRLLFWTVAGWVAGLLGYRPTGPP